MNKNEVFCILHNIFKNIFNDNDMVITYSTNSDELKNWDSLNHINLMGAIEKEFKKFGLIDFKEIEEPIKHLPDELPINCFMVYCQKK